jgi:hypothetical protein
MDRGYVAKVGGLNMVLEYRMISLCREGHLKATDGHWLPLRVFSEWGGITKRSRLFAPSCNMNGFRISLAG